MAFKLIFVFGAAMLAGGSSALGAAEQPQAISRTDLSRNDISVAGREAVQVRVDFPRHQTAPRHSHPGEEIVYVLKGSLEYRLDGERPRILRAGDVLFIPYGTVHAVTNVGGGEASELATYIVEKGKALVVPAK